MSCIFCRVIRGELGPVLSETSLHVVIADISPASRGHLLFIPKYHSEKIESLPDEYLLETLLLMKRAVKILNFKAYNILQNNGHGQTVPHVHFHLIPYDEERNEGLEASFSASEKARETFSEDVKMYREKLLNLGEK
ncbi:uncharacterized protein NEMAJ01_0704 [Nematocida major]|uniref:uncharacterized protein n=1 Tax=Nematocida major TaxID=1912982 RepID=UPI002007DA41|nr:uncharacterized protein NEMAJ01_0704 [Nematocida major]KAH9385808.1 hypothetical protein NEMAJ01_0704 [Nematocida major]